MAMFCDGTVRFYSAAAAKEPVVRPADALSEERPTGIDHPMLATKQDSTGERADGAAYSIMD